MIVDGKKRCSICGIVKEIKEFNKDGNSSDGYRSECKNCRKVKYNKRRQRYIKMMKEYDKKHKTEKANYNREYYLKNNKRGKNDEK